MPDVRRIDPNVVDTARDTGIPVDDVELAVELAGIALDNPITTASGCFASGAEIDRFYDVTELGAVVVKSITLEPREGLPTPRMAETPSGMLNAIGLQNPGIDAWLERDLPWLQGRGAKVIASLAGKSVEEYREVARRLRGRGAVVGLEVNLSCPNVEHRGLVFACSPDQSAQVVAAVAEEADVPVFAKLTSDVTDIVTVARSVTDAGADGLTLINTLLGMSIDPETGRPRLSNVYGGLSGPAIRPVAVRNVHQVATALPDVPIIGCGGVRTVADVVEFTRAGATAVAVGTSTFVDPFVGQTLVAELRSWLARRGIRTITELRGKVVA
ncbi:dihydroorotate dehydrogenase [Egicoccus halophilus]|uniref:Dihydroorotate dehydrogenase n=1 Tax=Egicoccus halophilus TaxID=1670830 RepID=A0A8J3AFI6_9ACTN|nr:dihydroorotate dehydrogenase [Egicoccus halophilus]GGI07405.1 dihydroorotate dehydrogenase B (NAD(+)), catalytic subunit [Egicoccus halophilus]